MQPLSPGEVPFTTDDAILACSLYMAGVPFQNEQQPCFNIYDADTLKRLGFSGMTLEAATKAAFESGKKGHVEYAFRAPKQLQSLLRAYTAQQQEIKDGVGTAQELQLKIMKRFAAGEMDEHEALLRISCVNLKMRVQFMNIWKQLVPWVRVDNPGKATTQKTANGIVTRHPGFKMLPLNASDEVKRHLKV